MSIEQPRTCEELFKAVRRAGCRVNNLFHRMDGLWQCNLRGMGVGQEHRVEQPVELGDPRRDLDRDA